MTSDESKKDEKLWYFRQVLRGFFSITFLVAIIFLLAGRLDYWQGWLFGGFLLLLFLIQIVAFRNQTELGRERLKPGPGTKWWDKLFLALNGTSYLAIIVIACLDTGRFLWSAPLPVAGYIISYIVFSLSIFAFSWAMWVNKFFSSVVRIQSDRGQEVVQSGPYRFVRHPGYVGGILLALSNSLVFGSFWGLIPAAIVAILIIIRTCLEDVTLQKELPGYADYARRVRYRLLPGIW